MQTIKLKYEVEKLEDKDLILQYLKQYSNCLHFMYNRVKEEKSEKECRELSKSLNHIELLDSYLIQCSIKDAIQLPTKDKVIFGGKKNYFDRMNNKISKEEFRNNRLSPLYIIGEATHYHCNRKFQIQKDLSSILFKPSKKIHINLELGNLKKNYKKILNHLVEHQKMDDIPITYKLSSEYVYISFDEKKIYNSTNKQIHNRILAFDLNPNYIGWSIVDWKDENDYNVIKMGVYSLKSINDTEYEFKKLKLPSTSDKRKYITNKRKTEVIEIAKNIISKAQYYKCEYICFEDLNIKSSNKGKRFNRLCNNQWLRNDFINNIQKRCNQNNIKHLKVIANYSSFIGNILFRDLKQFDAINSSIEIGRRGFEFKQQYINKTKEVSRNIIQPKFEKFEDKIIKSLEEFNYQENFKDLIDLYYQFKNSKMMYRVPFNGNEKWFKLKSKKSNVGFIENSLSIL